MSEHLKGQQDNLSLSPGFRNLVDAHAQRTALPPEKVVEHALKLYDRHSPLEQHPEPSEATEAVELKVSSSVLADVNKMSEETGVSPDDILSRSAGLALRLYNGLRPEEDLFVGSDNGNHLREFPTGSIPRKNLDK